MAGGFVVFFLILLLVPYAAGKDFGIFKVPEFGKLARKRLKFVAPLLLVSSIVGFIPIWTALGNASDYDWVTVKPIEDLRRKQKEFSISSDPPPSIEATFRSESWGIELAIAPSANTRVNNLRDELIAHFNLREHLEFDLSAFPAGFQGWWVPEFVLTVNGRVIEDSNRQSLASLPVKDGDVLRLAVRWVNERLMSGGVDEVGPRWPPAFSL